PSGVELRNRAWQHADKPSTRDQSDGQLPGKGGDARLRRLQAVGAEQLENERAGQAVIWRQDPSFGHQCRQGQVATAGQLAVHSRDSEKRLFEQQFRAEIVRRQLPRNSADHQIDVALTQLLKLIEWRLHQNHMQSYPRKLLRKFLHDRRQQAGYGDFRAADTQLSRRRIGQRFEQLQPMAHLVEYSDAAIEQRRAVRGDLNAL